MTATTGFHGQVDRPVLFHAGEKGAERVDIIPNRSRGGTMSDPIPKPPGRGQGQGAIAGHEKGQDALIDGLVQALSDVTDRVVALENAADATP